MKPAVGQVLYFVGSHRHNAEGRDVTVFKVGRKWAHLDNGHRIDLETWWADGAGYASPGCCYVNRDAHWHEVKRGEAWNALYAKIRNCYGVPAGLSAAQIEQAAALIGFDITTA